MRTAQGKTSQNAKIALVKGFRDNICIFLKTFFTADLRDVNSNCKTKIRELNVCKSELSKLSSLVEDKLQMMEATKDSASNAKQRSDDLENDLKKAKSDIDRFSSSLGRCPLDIYP